MEILLLALFGAVASMGLTDFLDDDDAATEAAPDPDDDMVELDTGASVVAGVNGGIHIELGDDETGSLTALKMVQVVDGETFVPQFTLGIFLVPEGVEIPVDPTGAALSDYATPEEMIEELGLTELVSFDLGAGPDPDRDPDGEDTRTEPPEITANAPIDIIRIHYGFGDGGLSDPQGMQSEPDETLSPFEAPGIYWNGVEAVEIADDFTGSDAVDFAYTPAADGPPISVDGAGGDDVFVIYSAQSTVLGRDGDDTLFAIGDMSSVEGGNGDDTIYIGSNATAYGGDGNDQFTSIEGPLSYLNNGVRIDMIGLPDDAGSEFHGGEGNDRFHIGGAAKVAYGNAGDDTFSLEDGAQGFGGEGADSFNAEVGTTADGGSGDDYFQINEFFDDITQAATLTGGDGADVFEIGARNIYASRTGTSAEIAHITDFVPGVDTISIVAGYATSIAGARVEEAADGSYSNLIVELESSYFQAGDANAELIIRLDGVTGYTADQLIATS